MIARLGIYARTNALELFAEPGLVFLSDIGDGEVTLWTRIEEIEVSPHMNVYDIGDRVYLNADFTDIDGAPIEPTDVECKVRRPDKTVETLTAIPQSAGRYTAEYDPTEPGRYDYSFKGSGNVRVAGERFFTVKRPRVTS